MTELFINNKRINLNDSISIKLVDENSYFTDSSKYTYDVDVPLRGNSNNLKILGNLQRLDEEAGDAWRRVQEQRTARLDASLRLLDALDAAGELADAPTADIRQALAACRGADGPEAATEADSALARAWRSFSAVADMSIAEVLDFTSNLELTSREAAIVSR